MALIRYLHYDGGILVKTYRNGIEFDVVTSKRNRVRFTPLSGSTSQVATTSGLFNSQNPPLIKALLAAMLNGECFWLKSYMSSFLGLDEIRFFFFFLNLIGIIDSFRQRYIYLLKLVQSSVMVITPILVVNLGQFSIDK